MSNLKVKRAAAGLPIELKHVRSSTKRYWESWKKVANYSFLF